LIYPIATIFVIWAISGHVGPAAKALGLQHAAGWSRGLAAAVIGFSSFAFWRDVRARGWKSRVWIAVAGIGVVAFAFAVSEAVVFAFSNGWDGVASMTVVADAASFAVVFAVVFAVADDGAAAFAGAVAFAFAFAFANTIGDAFLRAVSTPFALIVVVGGTVAGTVAGAVAVAALSALAIKYRLQGVFLSLFLPAMILACLIAADSSSVGTTWRLTRPLLLFLGLLTLLNAPFDWASLGLTRALLRRGLELGGWWPYLLALVDACLAGVIIAFLVLTMVIGVQAFDELAVHGGGEYAAVLDLPALFDGIAKNPVAPEYWWAYALLLSSMIPSIINLAIGGMAFTRGIPWLARLLLQWIPEGKAVPEYKRQPAAIGLTVQMFAGAFLGIAAQAFLAWGLIFHLMPWIGLDLLKMARAVAAFDLPARVAQLFIGLR
jgi:hypothetical protein